MSADTTRQGPPSVIAHTLTDRLAFFCVRSAAVVMLFAGLALVAAGVPMTSLFGGSAVARHVTELGVQTGATLGIAAGLVLLLCRERWIPLPNELRLAQTTRPAIGGWLLAVALTLLAVPAWLVLQLQPFLREWLSLLPILADVRLWDGANANGSGVVLIPIAAALTPPLLELMTMAAMVAASAGLLVLLLRRSVAFPRLYVAIALLLLGLTIAAHRGATAALLATLEVRRLMATSPSPKELAVAQDVLTRYISVVSAASAALPWACLAYLVWTPLLVTTNRARVTFSAVGDRRGAAPLDAANVDVVTRPPTLLG